jgi:hypothetical protein
MTRVLTLIFAAAAALPSSFAAAQTVDLSIDGDEAKARIELLGSVSADLTIRFEKVVGLSEQSLGLSVSQVDPLSPALLGRLPNATEITIPSGFPLMISIDPPAAGGLSFEGVAEVEIYTTALHYSPATPLRLFKSSHDEPFRDITDETAAGSYRVRGSGGQWSDFLILADTRLLDQTIEDKFDGLQNTLSDASGDLDSGTFGDLQLLVDDAYAAWLLDDVSGAVQKLVQFEAAVQSAADAGLVPKVWRSTRDLDNFEGMLRARASTLRYSLGLAG